MTRLQKIQLKMSECRQAINTLLDVENRTEEQQADLERRTGEIQQCEPELRAAIAAEPDPITGVLAHVESGGWLQVETEAGVVMVRPEAVATVRLWETVERESHGLNQQNAVALLRMLGPDVARSVFAEATGEQA